MTPSRLREDVKWVLDVLIDRRIETIDLVPMASHLAGIDIDRQVDGKNQLPDVR